MKVDSVLDRADSLLKASFEALGIFVAQLILVVADGIEHRSEELKLLIGPNVGVFEELGLHFLENIVRIVLSDGCLILVNLFTVVFFLFFSCELLLLFSDLGASVARLNDAGIN